MWMYVYLNFLRFRHVWTKYDDLFINAYSNRTIRLSGGRNKHQKHPQPDTQRRVPQKEWMIQSNEPCISIR